MKTKHILPVCALLVLLFSCKQNNAGEQTSSDSNTIAKENTQNITPANTDTSTVISLLHGTKSATANIIVDSLHPNTIYYIEVGEGNKIQASLTPEHQPANIRFNQMIDPDGKADGPFGQTLSHPISTKGKYTLRIGPSQMAEGRYSGKVLLKVEIE